MLLLNLYHCARAQVKIQQKKKKKVNFCHCQAQSGIELCQWGCQKRLREKGERERKKERKERKSIEKSKACRLDKLKRGEKKKEKWDQCPLLLVQKLVSYTTKYVCACACEEEKTRGNEELRETCNQIPSASRTGHFCAKATKFLLNFLFKTKKLNFFSFVFKTQNNNNFLSSVQNKVSCFFSQCFTFTVKPCDKKY